MPKQIDVRNNCGLADFDAVAEFAAEVQKSRLKKNKAGNGAMLPLHPMGAHFPPSLKLTVQRGKHMSCSDTICSDTTVPDESECESLSGISQSSNPGPISTANNNCSDPVMIGHQVYAPTDSHDNDSTIFRGMVSDSSPSAFAMAWSQNFRKNVHSTTPKFNATQSNFYGGSGTFHAPPVDQISTPETCWDPLPMPRYQMPTMPNSTQFARPQWNEVPQIPPFPGANIGTVGGLRMPHWSEELHLAECSIQALRELDPNKPCKVPLSHYECEIPRWNTKLPVKKRLPKWKA